MNKQQIDAIEAISKLDKGLSFIRNILDEPDELILLNMPSIKADMDCMIRIMREYGATINLALSGSEPQAVDVEPLRFSTENGSLERVGVGVYKIAPDCEEKLTIQDYEEVLADHRRLVRELDVALHGDGAAQQASLCDIVAIVKRDKVSNKGWQPIETAPVNEWLLVHYAKEITDADPNCFWGEDEQRTISAKNKDGMWIDDEGLDCIEPTHWMPLPPAPVEEMTEAGE